MDRKFLEPNLFGKQVISRFKKEKSGVMCVGDGEILAMSPYCMRIGMDIYEEFGIIQSYIKLFEEFLTSKGVLEKFKNNCQQLDALYPYDQMLRKYPPTHFIAASFTWSLDTSINWGAIHREWYNLCYNILNKLFYDAK